MWRSYAALAAARLGERDRAARARSRRSSRSRGGSALRSRSARPCACGRCSPRPREMVELAREAVDVLAGSELRLAHARALIDLGAALRRGGHRRDAREPLREGPRPREPLRVGGRDRPGDGRAASRRSAPAPPRASAASTSLSAQERRVAAMATEGLEQPRDRRGPVPHPPDRRDAPDRRVPQARCLRPGGAARGSCHKP